MTYQAYSTHRTLAAAEAALEDYFASDQICEAERPYIETGKPRQIEANGVVRWVAQYHVMFPA